jgi:tetratricopeptide (TPR) repeat protein/tetrahydromethanopterin S-methyltransferase subunit G
MGEGLLGGILGEENEKPEVEGPEAPVSAEAFAAAVAAKLAGNDPGVARKTEEFLNDQSHLLKIQAKHLEDEHAARVANLRHQSHLLGGQRIGQTIRISFQVVVALVALIVTIGFGVMLHDAFTSRSVVVEAFDSPPALVARGWTGKVLATGLLDELTRLQEATIISNQSKRSLSNAWSREVQIAVPETGISIGEISRLLRDRFGHDLHISGDLVETTTGTLALTVRGDEVPRKTFYENADGLEMLTLKAAEYVYAQAQPSHWAKYLVDSHRYDEAIAFTPSAFARTEKAERPRLLLSEGLALNEIGKPREALALFRQAADLGQDYFGAPMMVASNSADLGDEEGAWRASENMRHLAGGRPGRAPEKFYGISDILTGNLLPMLNAFLKDYESSLDEGYVDGQEEIIIADIEARLHDHAASELALHQAKADASDPSIAAHIHFVRGELAEAAGDKARAVEEMDAFGAICANSPFLSNCPGNTCWIAPAEEAVGHPEKADAVLKTGGQFVDCYRFRADILDGRGDWLGAQKTYEEAVALAPDLPAGYYSWGLALAKHGDLQSALAKLRDANQRGPHWADPLKAWGDVLVKQGNTKEALAKYDEALKYAPNWKQLHEARDGVAKQKA